MSYIFKGAQGQDWQGANWVFRGVSETLLSVLRETPHAEALAKHLEEAIDIEIGYMDVSGLLESAEVSAAWMTAVDRTIVELRKQGNEHWHKPEAFEPFLKKVAELKSLALAEQPA